MADDLKSRLVNIATRDPANVTKPSGIPVSRGPELKKDNWEVSHQRFTCWLSKEVVQQLRIQAKANNESISALTERILRSGLR